MKFSIGVHYKKLSDKCGFCVNQLTDVHTKGINVFPLAHSIGLDGFNPLLVQFKSLLPGKEGCVFFSGHLNTCTCHYVLLR
jgi:hypothetical protein